MNSNREKITNIVMVGEFLTKKMYETERKPIL